MEKISEIRQDIGNNIKKPLGFIKFWQVVHKSLTVSQI